MATQPQVSSAHIAQQMLEQRLILRKFRNVLQSHQIDLRLGINHMETIVGRIAKSADVEVREQLTQANLAIFNLRESLATFQIDRQVFDGWQERHNYVEVRYLQDVRDSIHQ